MDLLEWVKAIGSIIGTIIVGVFTCKYLYDYLRDRPKIKVQTQEVAEIAARNQFEYFYHKYEMLVSQRENEVRERDGKIAERDDRISKLETKINKLEREVNAREREHFDCMKRNEKLTLRVVELETRLGVEPEESDS